MKIRSIITVLLLIVTASAGMAKNARARLILKDKRNLDVLIVKVSGKTIFYKMSTVDQNSPKISTNDLDAVYFYRPPLFIEAYDLYQTRKFKEAKEKFVVCRDAFKAVAGLPSNYSTLAGFYALECNRRQLDLETLIKERKNFSSKSLINEIQLQQLEIYAFWEALALKDWARLDNLAKSWENKKVPGVIRAQIAYCHGVALENLAKKDSKLLLQALNTYNVALTADATSSTELAMAAINQMLGIFHDNAQVKLAMKLWGTKAERKNKGYNMLLEANSLTQLYSMAGFDSIQPLNPEYKEFIKFKPPVKKEAAKKPAEKKPTQKKKENKK